MAWLFLILAAIFEIAFATSMKASNGFTQFWPSVVTVIGVIGGITFLTLALRTLPVSIGYPMWVGVGALGTVVLGSIMFGESITLIKVASIAFIGVGVAGLKVAAGA